MITNTDATLYSRIRSNADDTWERIYIPKVWWYEAAQSSIITGGMRTVDALTVRIPDTSVNVKKGDYIVKGKCEVTRMETVKDLSGMEYHCVTGVNYNTFGGNPHIKVVGT